MNLLDVRAEIEGELTWRIEEIVFLKNLTPQGKVEQQDRYRKCLVVMLYSHFEGFWKAAFAIYVRELNKLGLICRDAHDCIVASSVVDILHALTDPNRLHPFFQKAAPADRKLHLFSKQAEFLGRVRDIEPTPVAIDAEAVVDTESNLSPTVVRKNLFRLGFAPNHFESQEGAINRLLETRNSVAHGALKEGVSESQYDSLEKAIRSVLDAIVVMIFESLRDKKYLRSA